MLLPPRHVSSGCFQASPLYSPYPVLCLCACSMAVTSLAVSRLQVAFWGNPSHKAGARGAVLVSIHGRLEGRSAGQVCFLRHRLTPGLCSATDGVPSGHVDPIMSPTSPGGQGTESLPFPYTRISAVVRRARPCQPSTAARVADAGCTLWQSLPGHQRSCRGHENGEVSVSLLGLPRCPGHWANGSTWPRRGASRAAGGERSVQQLDGHPAWKPAQRDRRRKAFMALTTEGRSASFFFFLVKQLLLG